MSKKAAYRHETRLALVVGEQVAAQAPTQSLAPKRHQAEVHQAEVVRRSPVLVVLLAQVVLAEQGLYGLPPRRRRRQQQQQTEAVVQSA